MKYKIAPSILAADFTCLKDSFERIEKGGAHWVHVDIMDGSFVPNISFGQPVVSALRPLTKIPFDVHLMINEPEKHVDSFIKAGADYITFHHENTIHQHRLVQQIKNAGAKAGISIVPSTPVAAIKEMLPFVDLVLVMSVNPGFGGQELIPECIKKIELLKKIRQEMNLSFIISVDGGVNEKTLPLVVEAGVDVAVSGSAFFAGKLD